MKLGRLAAYLLAIIPVSAEAQTAASPVLEFARFEQVALITGDLSTALTFYQDQLGLRLMFETGNMLFFDVSGTRLMVAEDKARQRDQRPFGILYFHVDDFAAAQRRLQSSGATLVGPIETVQSTSAGTLQLQQFKDPGGNMLAIMGYVSR